MLTLSANIVCAGIPTVVLAPYNSPYKDGAAGIPSRCSTQRYFLRSGIVSGCSTNPDGRSVIPSIGSILDVGGLILSPIRIFNVLEVFLNNNFLISFLSENDNLRLKTWTIAMVLREKN